MNTKAKILLEEGFSLISVAFLVMGVGLFFSAAAGVYRTWDLYSSADTTNDEINDIRVALQNYFTANGSYPCPASFTAAPDTAGFGVQVNTDCSAGTIAGTERAQGRGGSWVRTGAVPVRTLHMDDDYMFDGYGHRYVYAVTEDYAIQGTMVTGDQGAIFVQDMNGNNATFAPGNISYVVYSMGNDNNGAYTINGNQIQACDTTATSGVNCDYDTDAVFVNTVNKSNNAANLFQASFSYSPDLSVVPCASSASGDPPKDQAFIIDTSGSMNSNAGNNFCPSTMPGCSRIDVARWAMRRIVPSVIYNSSTQDDPGEMSMTGFVGYSTASNVRSRLGDIEFFNPSEFTDDSDGDGSPDGEDMNAYLTNKNDELNSELDGMCPTGSTPLGIHIQALAERLGDGTSTRPNKITVISDGASNNGTDPVAVARDIAATYPNIQVDIVDVVGNPQLMTVSQLTGGSYYRTDNPDALIDALLSSAGVCDTPPSLPPVTDRRSCGSRGSW